MNRRNAIRTGLIGTALLASFGYVSEPFWSRNTSDNKSLEILTRGDQATLRPVIDFFLAGAEGDSSYDPGHILKNLDQVIAGFPEALQEESVQLLTVIQSRLFTGITGGHWKPLAESSPDEIRALLLSWRNSNIIFLQSFYHGLQELIMSAWFSDENVWASFGYPGPPALFS